jgi:5-formyltetrahydrofolate cyclo-ligase
VIENLTTAKAEARRIATELRDRCFPTGHGAEDFVAIRFPISVSPECRIVSGFHPYQSEADIRPLLGRLAGEGWTPSLPVVLGKGSPLMFRRWLPGEPTVAGRWNIQQPPESSPEVQPDVLLVPLLAFDRTGYRLGYGGGFYDRTLDKLRKIKPVVAIGVGFSFQEVESVPHDELDQRLDFVMTDQEIFACA